MTIRRLSACVCCGPTLASVNRRQILAGGLATLGLSASGLFASGLAAPALAQARPAEARRIDVHHHLVPPFYLAAISEQRSGSSPRPWSPEVSLEEMDRHGVATAIVSIIQPGVWLTAGRDKSRAMAREVNEYGAKMGQDHPGRFGLWAAIPLPDTDGSLAEIAYALDTLHADGIGLMTSYGTQYLGDASFAPVWEELNRRKAIVYTHPQTPDCCRNLVPEVSPSLLEFATDTTRTMTSLLFTGTAARYPNIRWIFSHSGGTAPFLLSRFLQQEKEMKERAARLPNGVLYELKKFYYDTAQGNHKGALAALCALVPNAQILFGSDFPLRSAADEIEGLGAYGFTPEELAAIERDNALRLLPRFRG